MQFKCVLLALAMLFAGCPSMSMLQTPRTVPRGKFRGAVNLAASGPAVDRDSGAPALELGLRAGLTDHLDIGFKLSILYLEVGVKMMALRGPVDVAAAPTVSLSGGYDVTFQLPIIFGVNIGERLILAFGPKLMTWTHDSATALYTGFFVSLPIRVGGAFWIAPEFNWYAHAAGPLDARPLGCGDFGVCGAGFTEDLFSVGIALLFGGPEHRSQEAEPARVDPVSPPEPMLPSEYSY